MIFVTRTRLDDGSHVVAHATADDLNIVIDDRHITPAGATALARTLNALAPAAGEYPEGVERPRVNPDPA